MKTPQEPLEHGAPLAHDAAFAEPLAASATRTSPVSDQQRAAEMPDRAAPEVLGLAFPRSGAPRSIRGRLVALRKLILPLSLAALAVALVLGAGWSSLDLQPIRARIMSVSQAATPVRDPLPPVRVSVARVRADDVPIYLTGIGTVQAYTTVNVTTRVDGQITEILFKEGQDVKAGDVLAIIDPRPYQAQLEQQQAILRKDQALLDQAVADLKRYQALERTKAVSEQQADDQRYLVEQYRAQVKLDEAQVAYAKTQVEYTTIRSPISGRTGIRQVDQGNNVYAALNTTIVVITQLRPISVVFTLPARDVAATQLTLGQAHVPVAAYGADDRTLLDRGTVDVIDNVIDQTTGNIKLKASFPNQNLRLWPGDFINGRVVVDTRRQGLTVPPTALRHGPRGDYVWIVERDDTVRAQSVRVRQSADGRTLVEGAINPGQRVVTDGHFLLENNRRVEIDNAGPGPARGASSQPPTTPEQREVEVE
jgi:multidrug efflux system membrane fusion protein